MRKLILSVSLRLFVYVSVFCYYIVVANNVSAETFGKYSVWQSISEIGIVFLTVGSGFLYYRKSLDENKGFPVYSLVRMLVVGVPMTLLLMLLLIGILDLDREWRVFFPLFMFTLLLSVLVVFLNWLRGKSKYGLVISDPGARATISIVLFVVGGAYVYKNIELSHLFLINLISVVIMLGVAVRSLGKFDFGARNVVHQWHALIIGLLNFATKKGDIFLIAYFSDFGYVALFKLAFVVAESSYQFSQAYFVNISHALDKEKNENWRRILLNGAALGAIVVFGGFIFCIAYSWYNVDYVGLRDIFVILAIYFFIKSVTSFHEQFQQKFSSLSDLKIKSFFEVLAKAVFYTIAVFFEIDLIFVFLPLAIFDLVINEVFLKRVSGKYCLFSNVRFKI